MVIIINLIALRQHCDSHQLVRWEVSTGRMDWVGQRLFFQYRHFLFHEYATRGNKPKWVCTETRDQKPCHGFQLAAGGLESSTDRVSKMDRPISCPAEAQGLEKRGHNEIQYSDKANHHNYTIYNVNVLLYDSLILLNCYML